MADLRHGVATSVLANVNRNAEARPEPYRSDDFIHWRAHEGGQVDEEPILVDDPVAHSNLIRAAMFGLPPRV